MSSMATETAFGGPADHSEGRCPQCGCPVLHDSQGHPLESHCPHCNVLLWCSKRVRQNRVLLEAVPCRMVEISDITRVGRALQREGQTGAVIINLGGLETVSSSFLAGLLALHRLLEAAGSRLILCELQPHVAEILDRLNLHALFVIKHREQDALNAA